MAEDPTVHIAENSSEKVALDLLRIVARVEERTLYPDQSASTADRAYILDTFAECLEAVRGLRKFR